MAYETVADIIAERDRLKKALSFYADSTRYHGPNQRLDEPDEWSDAVGLAAYRLDVTRDGGMIARQALDQHNVEHNRRELASVLVDGPVGPHGSGDD